MERYHNISRNGWHWLIEQNQTAIKKIQQTIRRNHWRIDQTAQGIKKVKIKIKT